MNPIKFSIKNGKTTFHYPLSFLRKFLAHGKTNGNNGMILVGRTGIFLTYKGFGTIENPRTTILTFHVKHLEVFSGPMPSDKSRCAPDEGATKATQ